MGKEKKNLELAEEVKNEVCTNFVCTFSAIGKSKKEFLAYDELDSKGDGNYFTDDVNICNRYFLFSTYEAIDEYEKANKIKLKSYRVTITKTGKNYNIEISNDDYLDQKTEEKHDKKKKQVTETEIQTCQFYAAGISKKELIAYDGSYGGKGYFYTDDLFLCSRYNRNEAFIIAMERKINFFLVEINKTNGKYKKEISKMELPPEPPLGIVSQWNHTSALGGISEGLSKENLKSFIKALQKNPYYEDEYFSFDKTSIKRSQYSFLCEFEHYNASRRSGVPGHPPHENDFFARLKKTAKPSYKNWEIYDCTFENIYNHCREYFIINNNTVRQYIRFALKWNWGNHLYYIKEAPTEGYISKKVRPEIQKIINEWYRPMEVIKNQDESFTASCTATCKDEIYRLDVNVDKTGALTILRVITLAENVFEIDNSD
ncbi:MAG: hypothetical protein FWB86_06385 [Treponema sp.]|nr:hypothetical protein [Treponema sp.]MCL2251874.1 hypothetical protein [Treponema sp.]